MSAEPMTHAELVTLAEKWLWRQGCGVVFAELSTLATPETPDAIGFRTTTSILVECKATRADFLADKNKPFRRDPNRGMGDWRFYLTPKGLVAPDELPEGWGLIEVGKSVRRTHGGPKGNIWTSDQPFTGNKTAEQALLYSALRRLAGHGLLAHTYLPWESEIPNGGPTELTRRLAQAERRAERLAQELERERAARQQAETHSQLLAHALQAEREQEGAPA